MIDEEEGGREENQSVTKITETETEVSTDVPEMSGGWCIPALPTDRKIAVTGEEITDEEAKRYFDGNGNSILNSLQESGVEGSLRTSEKGYCHVSYDGTASKSLELRQNYRDYHVYGGERLVGIITLYKENGVIYNTVSFGAPWFDDFGTYLKEHEGEEIVFVYASFFEIIIAPDNSFINPMGHDPSRYLEGTENPYETFRHPLATYTP